MWKEGYPILPLSSNMTGLQSMMLCCFFYFSDDEADAVYVDPDITDSVNYQQPVMPPMSEGLTNEQVLYTAI